MGWGGYTEVVAFVHTLRNSYKKSTQVARASPNKLRSNNKNFELQKEYKRIHYFHFTISHFSILITLLIAALAKMLSVQN